MKNVVSVLVLILSIGNLFANDVKIGSIYYNLDIKNRVAKVIQSPNWDYNGSISIPAELKYDNVMYTVNSIGDRAFENCRELTAIKMPNTIISIGQGAFYKCSSLKIFNIPNSVLNVGNWALDGCNELTSPIYNANVFVFLPRTYFGDYKIPDGIVSISGGAFSDCKNLTSVYIPNSVKNIGEMAFGSCEKLTSILLPDSVAYIETWAFFNCTSLTSISIPRNVSNLGLGVFDSCSHLTSITCLSNTPPVVDGNYVCDNDAILYVPYGSANDYRRCRGWNQFKEIKELNISTYKKVIYHIKHLIGR